MHAHHDHIMKQAADTHTAVPQVLSCQPADDRSSRPLIQAHPIHPNAHPAQQHALPANETCEDTPKGLNTQRQGGDIQ